jgi:hypothetical protein
VATLAAHFLIPNGAFFASLLLALVVIAVVWLWPLVAVARRRQWGWFLAVLFFGPIAALVWLLIGRDPNPLGNN